MKLYNWSFFQKCSFFFLIKRNTSLSNRKGNHKPFLRLLQKNLEFSHRINLKLKMMNNIFFNFDYLKNTEIQNMSRCFATEVRVPAVQIGAWLDKWVIKSVSKWSLALNGPSPNETKSSLKWTNANWHCGESGQSSKSCQVHGRQNFPMVLP